MQGIFEKAHQRLVGSAEQPPAAGTKGWWADRAIMLEQQLGQQEGAVAPMFQVFSVSNKTNELSACRQAVKKDVSTIRGWPTGAGMLRRMHPWLSGMISMVQNNSYNKRVLGKRKSGEDDAQEAQAKHKQLRGLQSEMILSVLQRQRSIYNTPLLVVLKSMVAFRQGLNHRCWAGETQSQMLMSCKWMHDFVLELTAEGVAPPCPLSEEVCFCVHDNCDYHRRKAFDRTQDKAECIKTVSEHRGLPCPCALSRPGSS